MLILLMLLAICALAAGCGFGAGHHQPNASGPAAGLPAPVFDAMNAACRTCG